MNDENTKRISQYIEEFNRKFEIPYKEKFEQEVPILNRIFETFSDELHSSTKLYKELITDKTKLMQQLDGSLNDEQKLLIEKIKVCEDFIEEDTILKGFVYGYSIHNEVKSESKKIKSTSN